jgi:hypothetical protein
MHIIESSVRWLGICLAFLLSVPTGLHAADAPIPTLQIGTVTYSNVTVYGQTEKDLYISHAGGLENIKMSTLDAPALRALGLLEEAKEVEIAATAASNPWQDNLAAKLEGTGVKFTTEALNERLNTPLPKQALIIASSLAALLYLFTCYCLKRICQNAGTPPGILIWLPVLQMIPLLRAARMSPWLLLAMTVIWVPIFFLIPMLPPAQMFLGFALLAGVALANVIIQIVWVFRVVKSCGKSPLVAVLMLLPVTNLFAFLYLAFSQNEGGGEADSHRGPVKLGGFANA